MQIGLIGNGYWGKILLPKLEKLGNVKFICTSNKPYISELNSVDWVFIATPNDTHYNIVKTCLMQGVNVFCEKPLTLSYTSSLDLFRLAELLKVKLYIDDVFTYRTEYKQILDLDKNLSHKVYWSHPNINYYNNLYHDLYLMYHILNTNQPLQIKTDNGLQINNITFEYKKSDIKEHYINDINLTHTVQSNDALYDMLDTVLNGEPNYLYNMQTALYCNKIIDKIK